MMAANTSPSLGQQEKAMRYALLIYIEPPAVAPTDAENMAVMEQYMAFGREAVEAGVMVTGEALEGTNMATSVRVRNGQTLVTDGPFAETKEEFGGFYLIEAADLDEAIKWAAQIPGAVRGTIEVRPVVDFPSPSNPGDGMDAAGNPVPLTIAAG
jgi:hypothetical protein